jgi:hypothetical protein
MLGYSNFANEFKVKNSSFDLDRVRDLLEFEQREILMQKSLKKI